MSKCELFAQVSSKENLQVAILEEAAQRFLAHVFSSGVNATVLPVVGEPLANTTETDPRYRDLRG